MNRIGIDIGGTKIMVAAINRSGSVCGQSCFPTQPETGFQRAVDRISAAVSELSLKAGWQPGDLCGIGIGCTGPVDPKRGTVHNPFTLPSWDNCNLVTSFQDRFQVPVRLENDADVAALGEFHYGAGKKCVGPMVMLTFGTGVGFSAIVNGQILRGSFGMHPEMGHILVQPDGPECYCGHAGCLESLASGTALATAGQKLGLNSSRAVIDAARAGQVEAHRIVANAMRAVGTAAWILVHTYAPEKIILGGGVIDDHYELFSQAMRQSIEKAVLVPANQIEIVPAELGAMAGVVGAAALIVDRN